MTSHKDFLRSLLPARAPLPQDRRKLPEYRDCRWYREISRETGDCDRTVQGTGYKGKYYAELRDAVPGGIPQSVKAHASGREISPAYIINAGRTVCLARNKHTLPRVQRICLLLKLVCFLTFTVGSGFRSSCSPAPEERGCRRESIP